MVKTHSSFASEIVKHGKVLFSEAVGASPSRKTALLLNEKIHRKPDNGWDSTKIIRYWRNKR